MVGEIASSDPGFGSAQTHRTYAHIVQTLHGGVDVFIFAANYQEFAMDDNVKTPIRNNGAETLTPAGKTQRHKPAPMQQDHPHSSWPTPDNAGDKPPTDVVVRKIVGTTIRTTIADDEDDTTSTAARGSDDLMSQPIEPPPAVAESISQRLRTFVNDAGKSWSKLSSEELRQTNGYSRNLCLLVQDRYEMSHQQAEQQVKEFFELHPM